MANFIEIKKTDKNHSAFQFVASAAAKYDEGYFALSHIKIEPARVIASDGHRLHIVNIERGTAPGYYRIVKKTKALIQLLRQDDESNISYPDVDGLLTSLELDKREWRKLDYTANFECQLYAKVIRSMDESETLNYSYFCDAVQFASDNFSVVEKNPVVLRNADNSFMAIIMPMMM